MKPLRFLLSAAAVAALAAGAAGTLHAIDHGEPASADERARVVRFVKQLYPSGEGTGCTGVRVGGLWALTAAHCVRPWLRHFGDGGQVLDEESAPVALAVDGDRELLVVAGNTVHDDQPRAVVRRLDADGDEDFGFGVPVLVVAGTTATEALDVAVRWDGHVVVVGRAVRPAGTFALVVALGPGGAESFYEPAPAGVAHAAVTDDDGRLFVGGGRLDTAPAQAFLVAWDDAGAPLAGFAWDRAGTPGTVVDLVRVPGSAHLVALLAPPVGPAQLLRVDELGRTVATLELAGVTRLAAGPGGRVYAAGSAGGQLVVRRVSTVGGFLLRDQAYAATSAFGEPVALASLAVDDAGRVSAGGTTVRAGACQHGVLARFAAAGSRDPSFGHDGMALLDEHCAATASAVALAVWPGADVEAPPGAPPALVAAQRWITRVEDRRVDGTIVTLLAGEQRYSKNGRLEVAGQPVEIAQIFRHPDPAIDAALVSFAGVPPGEAPPPAELFYTGAPASLRGRELVCTGFGLAGGSAPVDVPLGKGRFSFEEPRGHRLDLVSAERHRVIPGDSGGPCWIEEPAGPLVVGIMEQTLSGALVSGRRGWSAASEVAEVISGAFLAPWIQAIATE